MYTNKHKKRLFEKINSLSKTEHEEIYKIIQMFNSKHTEEDGDIQVSLSKNKNGVFFNLTEISDELFEEIDAFVTYCINNTKDLDDYDKKINECKYNNTILHINLDNMPKDELQSVRDKEEDDWNTILKDNVSQQKVVTFIEKLMSDRDKVGKKKMNVKFNNAKKKYAKRVTNEKKIDGDGFKDLEIEPYLLTA
jgi:hypothetical protein